MDYRAKKVLITGGASGLGLALATRFVREGAEVYIGDLADSAPESVQKLGPSAHFVHLDVTKDEDWERALVEVGPVDVIVLNAGMAVGGRLDRTSMETWHKILELNVLGIVRGIKVFSPTIPRGGQIVVTASIMGLIYPGFMAAYNASKAAAVAIAETAGHELAYRKISATAICPQFFKTPLVHSLTEDDPKVSTIARGLMTKTWLDVDSVADRAFKDIKRRKEISTPDVMATLTWFAKRRLGPCYRVGQRGSLALIRKVIWKDPNPS